MEAAFQVKAVFEHLFVYQRSTILHQNHINVAKMLVFYRENAVDSRQQRLVSENLDVVNVRIEDLLEVFLLLMLQRLYQEAVIIGKEEE